MEKYDFEYFNGKQADQFSFFRIPKLQFTAEIYDNLSLEASFLYGILLDTMSLSVKNGWIDKDGRVYVMYGIESVCKILSCKKDKARKVLSELDDVDGIGLIEKRKQGQGKPDRIYVKNFILPGMRNYKVGGKNDRSIEDLNDNMVVSGMEPGGKNDQSEKPQSRVLNNRILDGGKTAPNNTENNNTILISPINPSSNKENRLIDRDINNSDMYRQISICFPLSVFIIGKMTL